MGYTNLIASYLLLNIVNQLSICVLFVVLVSLIEIWQTFNLYANDRSSVYSYAVHMCIT